MDRPDASLGQELLVAAIEADHRLAAALVRDADGAPRNGMSKGLARRLLRREETCKALRPIALAHRVPHLFLGVHLACEPRALRLVEAIALHLGQVDPDSDDHPKASFDTLW